MYTINVFSDLSVSLYAELTFCYKSVINSMIFALLCSSAVISLFQIVYHCFMLTFFVHRFIKFWLLYFFREADEQSNRVANAAKKLGLKCKDDVAVLMYNEPDFLWTFFGRFYGSVVKILVSLQLHESIIDNYFWLSWTIYIHNIIINNNTNKTNK